MAEGEGCARCGGAVAWIQGGDMVRCQACGHEATACSCPLISIVPDRRDIPSVRRTGQTWAPPDE